MEFTKAIQKIEEMLNHHKPQVLNVEGFKPAAVLIPLFSKNDQAHILLTLRTDTVEHHKGQISFPGGAREAQDENLAETALRETEEEIGLPRKDIRVLGRLDDFLTVTNFNVTSFVSIISYPFSCKLNELEVAAILEVPLDLFLSKEHFEVKEWDHGGKTYPVFFYYHENYIIWGATAFILNRFIEQVFGFNPAPQSVLHDPRDIQYLRENISRRGDRQS